MYNITFKGEEFRLKLENADEITLLRCFRQVLENNVSEQLTRHKRLYNVQQLWKL